MKFEPGLAWPQMDTDKFPLLRRGPGGFFLNVILSLSKGDPDKGLLHFDRLSMTAY
jgi:hypothetical protein